MKDTNKDILNIKENCARHSVTMDFMKQEISEVKEDVKDIKKNLEDFIRCADENYARKEEFIFWRNMMITGILGTIFLNVISKYFK